MDGSKFIDRVNSGNEFIRRTAVRVSHMDIELTERCDNNCIHCSINIPENSGEQKRELDSSRWKEIIREAADLGVLRARFTGGEPLLRKDFEELYLYTRKLGIKVALFTNARKITPELAELFSKIPPLEKIEVSVYGMSRESYEKVSRVPGSYDEFRSGVDLLLKYKIPFIVKGILLPDNGKDRDAFEKWASEIPWMDNPPSYSSHFEFRERRDSDKKNKIISSLRNIDNIPAAPDRSMVEFCSKFIGPPGNELFSCGAGESVSVDAYGFAHPCLTLKAGEFAYDLKKGSIKDAIFKYYPEKLKVKVSDSEYLKRCAKCFLKGLCLQCPSRSWSENGTFDTPVEFLCNDAHKQGMDAGLLKEGEKGWEVINWRERIIKMEEEYNGKNR